MLQGGLRMLHKVLPRVLEQAFLGAEEFKELDPSSFQAGVAKKKVTALDFLTYQRQQASRSEQQL
eukprot:2586060-Prorocentrum_lima.AAC.1